jgi:hypothetical protein
VGQGACHNCQGVVTVQYLRTGQSIAGRNSTDSLRKLSSSAAQQLSNSATQQGRFGAWRPEASEGIRSRWMRPDPLPGLRHCESAKQMLVGKTTRTACCVELRASQAEGATEQQGNRAVETPSPSAKFQCALPSLWRNLPGPIRVSPHMHTAGAVRFRAVPITACSAT